MRDEHGEYGHMPVLGDRVVELLAPALTERGAVCVDATVGMGGHSERLLQQCPAAHVIGIDRDADAVERARKRLGTFGPRFTGVQATYDEMPAVLAELEIGAASAVLFDLGVSSLQLDDLERGFAYRADAPLDMRMDQRSGRTAAEILNTYEAAELAQILRDYGEERYARRVATAILARREEEPFTTSGPLVELLTRVIPRESQRTGGHPAKRTFQALRIEVNAELSIWRRALPAAMALLPVGGRLVVLAYHSLEDRITKRVLSAAARSSAPAGFPVELPEQRPWARLLTRGAEKAGQDEIENNPRAASVRLRAVERTRGTEPDELSQQKHELSKQKKEYRR
ncbi:MAG: 16S rRNA (cytosine(1402)-N(4))-methyltransferase RsmH [Ornithinimicrobium sp.]